MDAPSGLREIRTDLVWIHQRLRRNDGERTFLCLLVISTTFVGDLSVRDGSVWQVLVANDVVVLWCCLKDSVAIVSSFSRSSFHLISYRLYHLIHTYLSIPCASAYHPVYAYCGYCHPNHTTRANPYSAIFPSALSLSLTGSVPLDGILSSQSARCQQIRHSS
jgi:hypothetical protein